jgi:hypothetical protein
VSGSEDSSASSEDCDCTGGICSWECIDGDFGLEWSRITEGCLAPCECYYPSTAPSYVGELIDTTCGCGCGNCAYIRTVEVPYWQQRAGCADYQDCSCPQPPASPAGCDVGEMIIYSCEPN